MDLFFGRLEVTRTVKLGTLTLWMATVRLSVRRNYDYAVANPGDYVVVIYYSNV